MVDGDIDPRTVEAMKVFRMETENANEVFRKLERHMNSFTNRLNIANVRTVDFARGWKDMRDMQLELPDVNTGRAADIPERPTTKEATPGNTRARQELPVNRVDIGTIRIDVSGVTDKTDKQKLADEISQKVAKSLQSSMGGPLTNSGYNRGM